MKKSFLNKIATYVACVAVATTYLSVGNVYAAEEVKNKNCNLEIISSEVPTAIISYGKNVFGSLQLDDIEYLDLDVKSAKDIRLCSQFQAFDDESLNPYNIYYFPVIEDKEVIAVLTVSESQSDGTLSYQFGKDDMTYVLNTACSKYDAPVEIHLHDECYYAVNSETTDMLYSNNSANTKTSVGSEIQLCTNVTDSTIVDISMDSAFSEEIASVATTYIGKKRPVVYVNNYVSNGHGTCWASCVGALSTYYNNPSTGGTETDGSNIRYAAILHYGATGDIDTVKNAINYYNNIVMTKITGSLSWSSLKTQIFTNNAPFYSQWTTSASGAAAHAMVVSGYRYDQANPSNSSSYGIYVMDPNHGTNQLISYGGTYTINGNPYTWSKTLYKS